MTDLYASISIIESKEVELEVGPGFNDDFIRISFKDHAVDSSLSLTRPTVKKLIEELQSALQ